jgi:hypothetical protein
MISLIVPGMGATTSIAIGVSPPFCILFLSCLYEQKHRFIIAGKTLPSG